ncbi:MAG: nucleotidyltransferase family protein [Candidatus Moranbacteria bacterium]|nr:nucleotidyltransferase family protein [Candidatus Moranbacteria bacterium]
MAKDSTFENIDVLVLCGGKGTRLRPVVSDKPKALADVGGKPFIEILLDILASEGFHRVILGVGYLKEEVKNHFQANPRKDLKIEFSEEDTPLGTGGAVKKAKPLIKSDHFLVLNGDSLASVDFNEFYQSHLDKKAMLSLALANVADDSSSYGRVMLASDNRIASFNEKQNLVSAGVYLMRKDVFDFMPAENSFSLEHDFFPKITEASYGFVSDKGFIDIGTPERYRQANRLFSK